MMSIVQFWRLFRAWVRVYQEFCSTGSWSPLDSAGLSGNIYKTTPGIVVRGRFTLQFFLVFIIGAGITCLFVFLRWQL